MEDGTCLRRPCEGGEGGAERGKDKEGYESVSSWEGEMEKVKTR